MNKIDAHVHIWPEERSRKLIRWIKRYWPDHPVDENITPEEILDDLARAGVTTLINLVYPLAPEESRVLNRFNYELARRDPRVHAFASLHARNTDKEALLKEACDEWGLLGVKFHPFIQKIDLRDESLEPVWSFCEKNARPIIIHTGFEDFYAAVMPPDYLEKIMRRHPELPLVVSHLFFPDLKSAFALLDVYPNIYLDITNVPGSLLALTGKEFVATELNRFFIAGVEANADRIFFGTDYPVGLGTLAEVFAQLDAFPLSAAARAALFNASAAAFLKRFAR